MESHNIKKYVTLKLYNVYIIEHVKQHVACIWLLICEVSTPLMVNAESIVIRFCSILCVIIKDSKSLIRSTIPS